MRMKFNFNLNNIKITILFSYIRFIYILFFIYIYIYIFTWIKLLIFLPKKHIFPQELDGTKLEDGSLHNNKQAVVCTASPWVRMFYDKGVCFDETLVAVIGPVC